MTRIMRQIKTNRGVEAPHEVSRAAAIARLRGVYIDPDLALDEARKDHPADTGFARYWIESDHVPEPSTEER